MIESQSKENNDLSSEMMSEKQPSTNQLWQKGRPIRLRKLKSANTVQNSSILAFTGKSILKESKFPNLGQDTYLGTINCAEPDVSRETIRTVLKENHSTPRTRLTSKNPTTYNEKIKTRGFPRQPVYKAASMDSETSISSTETIDDSMLDFIVNDSASEDELRRPPPSMRKSDKGPSIRSTRNQRRIVSDNEDEAEDVFILTETKITMELTSKLKELDLTNSPSFNSKFTYNGALPQAISQNSQDLFIHISEPQASRKALSSYNLPRKPPQASLQSPPKPNMQEACPHNDALRTRDTINDCNNINSADKAHAIKISSNPSTSVPSGSPQRGNLSSTQDHLPALIQDRRSFEARKFTIATEFLAELDRTITNDQLAAITRSNGGVQIVWSQTLKSVAGRASCRNETLRTVDNTTKPATIIPIKVRKATIELAASIIDNEDKLLNVLAHEFCHLANMLVSNVWKPPHGKSFKKWGAKVSSRFAHKNIHVKRTHSYAIDYKYIWACIGCGYRYKRHSKRIHPERQVCGKCKSRLVQIKPIPGSAADSRNKKGTNTNPYNNYVKKWFSSVKQEHPDWKTMEIMTELAKRYKVEKQSHGTLHKQNCKEEPECLDTAETEVIVVSSDDEDDDDSDTDDPDGCMDDIDRCMDDIDGCMGDMDKCMGDLDEC